MYDHATKEGYPHISLHDCVIEGIRIDERQTIFEFDCEGFWIEAEHPLNPFGQRLRTDKSELRMSGIQFGFVSVHIFREMRFAGRRWLTRVDNVSPDVFAEKINGKKWQFECIDEYYGAHRALFCGHVTAAKRRHMHCAQIEIYFGESEYRWNRIRAGTTP